jgi:hypothetical protein
MSHAALALAAWNLPVGQLEQVVALAPLKEPFAHGLHALEF